MKISFNELKDIDELAEEFTCMAADRWNEVRYLVMNSATEEMIIDKTNEDNVKWGLPLISKVGNEQLLATYHGMHIVIDNSLEKGIIDIR